MKQWYAQQIESEFNDKMSTKYKMLNLLYTGQQISKLVGGTCECKIVTHVFTRGVGNSQLQAVLPFPEPNEKWP